jgi:hypothetical protein
MALRALSRGDDSQVQGEPLSARAKYKKLATDKRERAPGLPAIRRVQEQFFAARQQNTPTPIVRDGHLGTPNGGMVVPVDVLLNQSPKYFLPNISNDVGGFLPPVEQTSHVMVYTDESGAHPGLMTLDDVLKGPSILPMAPASRTGSGAYLHPPANKDPMQLLSSSSPLPSPMMVGLAPPHPYGATAAAIAAATQLDSQAVLASIEPQLANDERLRADLETLARAFDANLASLMQAHHLAQQKVLAEARIRQQIPLDFNALFERAENQHAIDAEASQALKEAKEISEVSHIMQSVEAGLFPATTRTKTESTDATSDSSIPPPPPPRTLQMSTKQTLNESDNDPTKLTTMKKNEGNDVSPDPTTTNNDGSTTEPIAVV